MVEGLSPLKLEGERRIVDTVALGSHNLNYNKKAFTFFVFLEILPFLSNAFGICSAYENNIKMYQNYTGKNSQPPNPGNSVPSPQQQPGQYNQVGSLGNSPNPTLLNPGTQSSRPSYASMIIPSETTSKPLAGFGKL